MACTKFVKIELDGTVIVGQTDGSFDIAGTEIDVSSKDSPRWREYCMGLNDMTLNVTFLNKAYSATPVPGAIELKDLIDIINAGSEVTWAFTEYDNSGVKVGGAYEYSGSGFLSTASGALPNQDAASTIDMTIRVTGEPVVTTNPVP